MEETDILFIARKAVSGVLALTTRTALIQVVSQIGNLLLAILLSTEVFGIFFLVSAIAGFLNYFSDIGLAAALVQKKGKVTQVELKTTFTIQQGLVLFLVIISFLLSGQIQQWIKLSPEGLLLFKVLLVSFFLSSLKTIPSVLLERDLNFNLFVIPQIVETLVFYITAVFLAWMGKGVYALTAAIFLRGITGLVTMYLIAPWKPGIAFDLKAARELMSFGLPFQLNSFLALLKDDLFTLYLGSIFPLSYIGYIGWAKKQAEAPLRLIMDNIIRVTFPAYSRLQHDPPMLGKAVEKAVFFLTLFTLPLTLELIFAMKPFIHVIPRLLKWEPAMLSFYFFALAAMLSTISSPLVNVLNSIGKVKITLFFMIIWTVLTWALIPFLSHYFGYNAVAFGMFIIALSVIWVVAVAKRFIQFSILAPLQKPMLSAVPLLIFLLVVSLTVNQMFTRLIFTLIGGLLVWGMSAYIFTQAEIRLLIRKLR